VFYGISPIVYWGELAEINCGIIPQCCGAITQLCKEFILLKAPNMLEKKKGHQKE